MKRWNYVDENDAIGQATFEQEMECVREMKKATPMPEKTYGDGWTPVAFHTISPSGVGRTYSEFLAMQDEE